MHAQVSFQECPTRTFDKLGMFWLADCLPTQVRQEIPQIPRRVGPAVTIQIDHRQTTSLYDVLIRAHPPVAGYWLRFLKRTYFGVNVLNDLFIFGRKVRPDLAY